MNNEHVLILIDFDTYSIDLIKRGVKLARKMQCKYSIMLIASTKIKMELDFYYVLSECKKVCEAYEVEDFLVRFFKTDHGLVNELIKIRDELKISQIVLAKDIMTRWDGIFQESKASFLLRNVPSVDLHFITVEKTRLENLDYETAVLGYLYKAEGNEYILKFSTRPNESYTKGIFFKHTATDFNTGIFVNLDDAELTHYKVVDSKATKSTYQLKDYLSS